MMESALFCSHLGALGGEGGETRSYRESDQKLDQAKSKALEIYFRTFCRKSNTKKLQSRVLLEEMCWLPLKWLILCQNETQRSYLGLPLLPYWGFYPYSQSLYGRTRYSHADVITKFSGMDRLPDCLSNGTPLVSRFLVLVDWRAHCQVESYVALLVKVVADFRRIE